MTSRIHFSICVFLALASLLLPISIHTARAQTPSTSDANKTTIAPDNAALLYSPYNWLVTPNSAKTVNAGAYFRTLLVGTTTCKVNLTIGAATPYSQIYARASGSGSGGAWQEYIPTASGPQSWTLPLPTKSTTANRFLLEVLVKATTETQDRWNAQTTAVQVTGLTLDRGATVVRPTERKYRVLIYGDSITEGVRVNGYQGIPNDTDRNDVTLDYSYPLGELLDAEIGIVGFGATGMTRGGSGNVPALPVSYNQLWAGQPRIFLPIPDLVIYNEGTNESRAPLAEMTVAFATVIGGIGFTGTANTHAGLNGTRHLLLRPFGGYQAENLSAIALGFHTPNIAYGDTTGLWNPADAPDNLHPYGYAHINALAPGVAAFALPLLHLK